MMPSTYACSCTFISANTILDMRFSRCYACEQTFGPGLHGTFLILVVSSIGNQ